MTLDLYARTRVARLVDHVEIEIKRAAHEHDAEAIHDLRVSIRRLTQALRAFRSLLGSQNVKAVRKDLRELMTLAAQVRSRDIALELFAASGVPPDAAVCLAVARKRASFQRRIVVKAQSWTRREIWNLWRDKLKAVTS